MKPLCTPDCFLQHALMLMPQANANSYVVYHTNGSVDPERGTTGAAMVTLGETPDHCSTLQTELVIIKNALEHVLQRREKTVVLHTDSRSFLQVPQQWRPQVDNVRLITTILDLTQIVAAQGRSYITQGAKLRRPAG